MNSKVIIIYKTKEKYQKPLNESQKEEETTATVSVSSHKQTSLKLLKLHMKVVNLTEENEKLQTELASKEINF
jgi:ribosomal 50S subunit-associated protein YjgA (DUF615 family)